MHPIRPAHTRLTLAAAAALATLPLTAPAAPLEAYHYKVVENLGNGSLHITDFNDAGQFSGYTERYSPSSGYTYQVMVGNEGVAYPTILGKAHGINNAGTVAGEGQVGKVYGGFYAPYLAGNFSVRDKGFFYARDISDTGLIIGEDYESSYSGALLTYKVGDQQTKNWGRPAGSDRVTVNKVNTDGVVIGRADREEGHPGDPRYWSRAYYIDTVANPIPNAPGGQTFEFHTLPAYSTSPGDSEFSNAFDLNENGLIVGVSNGIPVAWRTRPLRGVPGPSAFEVKAINLGTLANEFPFAVGQANGCNDRNQIVGWSYSDEGRHAFLYSNGRMVDLNDLFTMPDGIVLTEAIDINNRGQIIAYANGQFEGEGSPILLTPRYGAAQEVPLLPDNVIIDAGHVYHHFADAQSGQWFDPEPAGSVKVVMDSASAFTDILELPYGFGDMTITVNGIVLGTFHAGDAVHLGSVTAFEVTWAGDPNVEELSAFPLKLAFSTDTASFHFDTLASVPEPATLSLLLLPALALRRPRSR